MTDHFILTPEVQQLITHEQAWHYFIVPKDSGNDFLSVFADENKWSATIAEELEILTGKRIEMEVAAESRIKNTLTRYYLRKERKAEKPSSLSLKQDKDFLLTLIAEAKELRSSDIHIECYEDRSRVRIRIDGLMIERYSISKTDYPALVNKIKIRANLDIAEKRLPQDGRIFFQEEGMRFDIRVSVLPVMNGEKIVLRLLGSDAAHLDVRSLGFSEKQLNDYLEGTKKPHGILLISGPTGSGKTTSLYATLKLLNKETTNILTIEDPIEYTLEGINQVQLKESIGLTFAAALRTFLRQDPDVIMLGEIRDAETAQMAIRAAMTGHLVLSTIHTNSAWGTVSRLTDMGVPPFLIASTLNTTVAQRLVRLLCSHCRREEKFTDDLLPSAFVFPYKIQKHFVAAGCEACYFTGYRGRKAIYEVIPNDHEVAEKIRTVNFDIEPLLKKRNIRTLSENAFELLSSGESSVEELYAVLLNNYA